MSEDVGALLERHTERVCIMLKPRQVEELTKEASYNGEQLSSMIRRAALKEADDLKLRRIRRDREISGDRRFKSNSGTAAG